MNQPGIKDLQIKQEIKVLLAAFKTADSDRKVLIGKLLRQKYKALPQIPGNCSECNMYKRVSEEDANYPFCSKRCWANATGRVQP